MKFELFIAKRYLVKGRKSSFISIISLVSIIGIAIGVAALIIALALISGFQNEIRNKILNSTAHVMINNVIGDGFAGYEPLIKEITDRFPEVESACPVVYGTVLLKGRSRNAHGAVLRGVDMDYVNGKTELWYSNIKRGNPPSGKKHLLLGYDIAEKLMLLEDEKVTVITPDPVLSPSGLLPRIKKMRVCGIYETGLYEMDNTTVIANLKTAQKLLGLKDKINYIQLYLDDIFKAEELKEKLKKILQPGLSVITWKDLNASLYSALELEKTVLFFTLTLIIVVASLNIVAGLILLVIQKMKDIGILLSYGATPRMIQRIFFIQGSIIGVVGTTVGMIIGLGFCYIGNTFQLIKVPSDIYQMSYVPFDLGLFEFLAVISAALLISFTATLIPSRKAATVNVVDAIKNE